MSNFEISVSPNLTVEDVNIVALIFCIEKICKISINESELKSILQQYCIVKEWLENSTIVKN